MTGVHKLRLMAFALAVLTALAAFLGAPPQRSHEASRSPEPRGPSREPDSRPGEFRRKNPFRLQRVHLPPAPSPAPEVAPRPPPPTRPPPPPLPLKLVGTIDAGRYAMAFFADAGQRQLALEVATDLGEVLGDDSRGLILAEIQRKRAVIRGRGQEIVLEVAGSDDVAAGDPAAAPASPAPRAAASQPEPEEGTAIELSRGEVARSISNIAHLITQASAQPYFDKGLPAGIRLSRIRPGSVPDRMGLQNGDVVRGVDGTPIRTLPDAVKLLRAFQAGGDLGLEVLRGGRPRRIRYRVR